MSTCLHFAFAPRGTKAYRRASAQSVQEKAEKLSQRPSSKPIERFPSSKSSSKVCFQPRCNSDERPAYAFVRRLCAAGVSFLRSLWSTGPLRRCGHATSDEVD